MKMLTLFLVLFYSLSSQVWAGDKALFDKLPPDPGEAGKATLAGIDSDNDGVRDDVQRWIALTYPNSQKTRAALRQMAKAKQNILLNAADVDNARVNADIADNAAYCISYVRESILGLAGSDAYDIKGKLRAVYLNTYNRTKAWLQYDSHLSGFFTVPADLKQGCNFDPDAMAN